MNVLIIPEDFRNDEYILKPIFRRLFGSIGKPRARVQVCHDPRLGGVGEAMKSERIAEIVNRYEAMTDVFILCVDRDGVEERRRKLDGLERRFGDARVFLAENAWEELETWVLAGLKLPKQWRWADVRAEISVKERYFDVLARRRGVGDAPGGGRKPLAEEAARQIGAIRQKCVDDFDTLARRLEEID